MPFIASLFVTVAASNPALHTVFYATRTAVSKLTHGGIPQVVLQVEKVSSLLVSAEQLYITCEGLVLRVPVDLIAQSVDVVDLLLHPTKALPAWLEVLAQGTAASRLQGIVLVNDTAYPP